MAIFGHECVARVAKHAILTRVKIINDKKSLFFIKHEILFNPHAFSCHDPASATGLFSIDFFCKNRCRETKFGLQ